MGKGDRKKKAKKAPAEFALKKPAPRPRRGQGSPAYADTIDARPMQTVLEARCRMSGRGGSQDDLDAMRAPYIGSDVGRCLDSECDPQERDRLWTVWQGYCQAHWTYAILVLGITPHAKGAALQMVRERIETDQSHSIDTRSHDDRVADAKASRARWDGYTAQLSGAHASALAFARTGGGPDLWRDGKIRPFGRVTVKAVRALADAAGAN